MNAPNTNPVVPRECILSDACDIIESLPRIGALMITAKQAGVTHERIGAIESVTMADGWLVCSGKAHDSRIDPSLISTVTIDRTSVMQEQVYPRLDFIDKQGVVVFGVVGFGGLDPFDAALSAFDRVPMPPAPIDPPGERPEVAPDDPGRLPFDRAMATTANISITMTKAGFEQSWSGPLTTVKPARGFINIMHPDFHLHIRAGSVSAWRQDDARPDRLVAFDQSGAEIGLVVNGLSDSGQGNP